MRHPRGFTLIESTIVLLLIALSTTFFAVYSLNTMGTQFYTAKEGLKADLRRTKDMALNPAESANGSCSAAISMAANQYTLFYNRACDGAYNGGTDIFVQTVALPTGILIDTSTTINFKIPYGEVTDTNGALIAADTVITVKTADGKYRANIHVTPLGQVYQQ